MKRCRKWAEAVTGGGGHGSATTWMVKDLSCLVVPYVRAQFEQTQKQPTHLVVLEEPMDNVEIPLWDYPGGLC